MDDHALRLAESMAAVQGHPGYGAYREWDGLAQTYRWVFHANHQELIRPLERLAVDWDFALEVAREDSANRETFLGTITQRLHNYVAGAATLVDHSRRVMRAYTEGEVADEYERRTGEIAESEEATLLQGLRNYSLHRKLPGLAVRISAARSDDGVMNMSSELELDVAQLLEFDWKAPARATLERHLDGLPLRPIVQRHGEVITELNSWLLAQFESLHGRDIAEVNILIGQYNSILSGGRES